MSDAFGACVRAQHDTPKEGGREGRQERHKTKNRTRKGGREGGREGKQNPKRTVPCVSNFFCNKSAYFVGCNVKNAAPKHAENVAWGSVIPRSVPATLAVYPLKKWYIACPGDSFATGGSTPKASHVKKMTLSGCPPMEVG